VVDFERNTRRYIPEDNNNNNNNNNNNAIIEWALIGQKRLHLCNFSCYGVKL
jgi:hypothetical protein